MLHDYHRQHPEMGARHPFEAYLVVGAGGPLPPAVYHYCVDEHALERTGELPEGVFAGVPIRLAITALPERCQWRYRYSIAYQDLFIDRLLFYFAGHGIALDRGFEQ